MGLILEGVFRGEEGDAPNGHTLIARKHFTGCYNGYLQLSDDESNTHKATMTKRYQNIRQTVTSLRLTVHQIGLLQPKILCTPLLILLCLPPLRQVGHSDRRQIEPLVAAMYT